MAEPVQDEPLREADAVLRRRGFGDVANILQQRIAEKEKAGYIARIAELEQEIEKGKAQRKRLLAKLQEAQATNRALEDKNTELRNRTVTEIWYVVNVKTGRVTHTATSEFDALGQVWSDEYSHGSYSVDKFCDVLNRSLDKHDEERRNWRALECSLDSEIATLSKHLVNAYSLVRRYESQGLLSRIFRRELSVEGQRWAKQGLVVAAKSAEEASSASHTP
jgi:DNA repair exonuclease SbcCD ATPase subunit